VKCAKTTTNKNFSIVVVKNNPNITFKIKTIMYGEKVLLRQFGKNWRKWLSGLFATQQ